MSAKAIDYKIILKRDGQTQQQRMPALLDPSLAQIDQRTKADYYKFVQDVSKKIKFFEHDPNQLGAIENGQWDNFFELTIDEINAMANSGSLPPHLALWNSFVSLMEKPTELMNTVTQRHLDFYYHDVLKINKQPAVADKTHVIFELKKNTENTLLQAGTLLSAGKDNLKKEISYQLQHDLIVNTSKVIELKTLYINPLNKNFIFHAPIANSKDGLGAVLDIEKPNWYGFGNLAMPLAQIGFCLSSSVLKMKEGSRTVTVLLTLKGLDATATNTTLTDNLFKVSITGEKGWIGPKMAAAVITSSDLVSYFVKLTFQITKEEPAVIVYDKAVHGGDFDTVNPILQILLNNEKTDFGYQNLINAEVVNATIEVDVQEISSITLENDFGTLNPKKPFKPFGPLSEDNSNFSIQHEETFSKRLKQLSIAVNWKNIPQANLKSYFANYNNANIDNSYFTASASFKDGFLWRKSFEQIKLFNADNAQLQTRWQFNNPDYATLFPFFVLPQLYTPYFTNPGQSVLQNVSSKISYLIPGLSNVQQKTKIANAKVNNTFKIYKPALQLILNLYKDIRKGQLHLKLNHSFLFKDFREKYTAEILRYSLNGGQLKLPSEPFSPEIQSLSLNYTATTAKIGFSGTTLNDYIDEEIEFFHAGPFGQAREHAYTRSKHSFLNNSLVKLLPEYRAEGELYIGLSDLDADESASLLFQVAEGSANPEKPKIEIAWSVLCDNYWKQLTKDDFIFDTTNGLLTSGVMKFTIPREATTSNTILPDELLWIKASIKKDIDGVCKLIDVQANAAITVFKNDNNDPLRLANALPAHTISKLNVETASIKKITQPYASFGGSLAENDSTYYTRVSERLRHKEKAVGIWDYERLILQHFPTVHKVKCINHATSSSFYAPGHTLIVVVPDLTNQNAVDPFKPKLDKNTIDEIGLFLSRHASAWVSFKVVNPTYEAVKVAVNLKLKKGYEFNYYQKIIDGKLKEFFSPWIKNNENDVHFGGKITKSMVIKFLEDLDYVDYLTDLSLQKISPGKRVLGRNVEVAEASNPTSILVSHTAHNITNDLSINTLPIFSRLDFKLT